MKIDLNPAGGGVLIQGDRDELDALAETFAEAIVDGHAEASILTNEAVETVTVQRLPGGGENV